MLEIREVGPDDWATWRPVRLAALAESPQAFGSKLADWQGAGDTEERWRGRLAAVPFNLVAVLDGSSVGMVSAVPSPGGTAVQLISMWVAPSARGHGVGDALVTAVLTWAAGQGGSVVLSVMEANDPAIRLYRRHGFEPGELVGAEPGAPVERWMSSRVVRHQSRPGSTTV